ncbi:uncharacterized protein LOC119018863 isoform X3 [Acanthopagrus latus]|uniref:uncharacterized protein LOC119018863 isoform X3 n=1 Tax=Acanthopagrus latus TaxID=8177 RepID=UPI00187C70CC|nr:uncharacterized protein LOC119018863 isoform X3 [Acanthopagrus latus]
MSLRSGRSYLKDYTTTQQDEASGGKEADVVDQATERHEQARAFDDKSQSSRASTRHSHLSSSTASSATKAYAKAKAARAQLAYAAKEADIMKQKADLEASILKQKADYDASLHLLQCERVAAAAEAEATAYEEVESGELRKEFLVQEKPLSSIERTSEYIQQQSQLFMELPSKHEAVDSLGKPINKTETHHAKPEVGHDNQSKTQWAYKDIKEEQPTTQHISNPERERIPESQGTQDLARYLIRREMVSGGLLQFDDKPENYWSWKASFLSATKDLNLSPREELDLMTKWLGAESSEQAKRIRAVHVLNPAVGVNMVWQRLEECYGTPEVIEDALLRKIENFPRLTNKDNIKLRELGDILLELECAKEDGVLQGLSYLDTARGVKQIVEKLPYNLQEKWTIFGSKYKEDYAVAFPPFTVFSKFVRQQAKIKNDPSFILSTSSSHASSAAEKPVKSSRKTVITTHKTDIPANFTDSQNSPGFKKLEEPDRQCPIHKKPHPLKKCKLFRDKSLEERKTYLRENRICYRCCGSTQHMAKDCKITVKCLECNSDRHIAALHPGPPPVTTQSVTTDNDDSGEQSESSSSAVTSKCTEICGNAESARSCSKICLVKAYPAGKREKAIRMYAVLDEQSNKSLAKTEFFDIFEIKTTSSAYTMKTCSGKLETSGRRAVNFIIESMDGKLQLPLPTLIECDMVPDDRTEIPTAEIALHHPHLQRVADKIQPVDKDAPILLLLGRDIIRVHKVREQINGPHNAPYAQRLDLGWVIVGEACLGTVHKPSEVNVYKTNTLQNGRTSFLKPCPNRIHVKDDYSSMAQQYSPTFLTCEGNTSLRVNSENLGHSVFDRCKDDDRPALSIDDRVFLAIMDAEVTQNKENSWVAPLPFRTPRRRLPSNREQALKRLCSLRKTLEKRPKMKEDYVNFMQKMIDNDQAEPAPPLDEDSNPADHATRFIPAAQLQHSNWFSGPTFLYQDKAAETPESNIFTLVEPEADEEIRPEVVTLATKTSESHLGSQRWERFSSWRKLCRTVARLIHVAASFKEKSTHTDRKGWKSFKETPNINELSQAKAVIIHSVQQNVFKEELNCVKNGHTRLKNNTLKKLNPVVDEDGLLRVGGRLSLSDVSKEEKHPLIIPHNDHIATLLVRHFHEQVAHQGRHITEGAIRAAGYWIIGGKRLVSSVIHKCITCRKLRGKLEHQKMADLPADRLTPEPPFTSVGLDVFGPWPIMTRRTRGGSADSKRWAILFTCMSSRAVHIELIETMSTDSFINALRRFFSIRGPAKLLRSDRGTNFVGACKELHINTDDTAVRNYLQEKGCSWVFNPPHASHMGGSWERLIGVARRILDALLLQRGPTRLTHEVLSTLMAEVMAIINARPIVPISTDPDMPAVLTPAMILTQKASALSAPSGSFDTAQLYGKQWKQVQCLADTFWKRWRGEYLSSLQGRRKWTKDKPNVKVGDVVLLKDSQAHRNEWPIGLVIKTLPSNDERVRKVEVRTVKDGTAKVFLRPVTETVVLLSETE